LNRYDEADEYLDAAIKVIETRAEAVKTAKVIIIIL
jgi:hypothetical protein